MSSNDTPKTAVTPRIYVADLAAYYGERHVMWSSLAKRLAPCIAERNAFT